MLNQTIQAFTGTDYSGERYLHICRYHNAIEGETDLDTEDDWAGKIRTLKKEIRGIRDTVHRDVKDSIVEGNNEMKIYIKSCV